MGASGLVGSIKGWSGLAGTDEAAMAGATYGSGGLRDWDGVPVSSVALLIAGEYSYFINEMRLPRPKQGYQRGPAKGKQAGQIQESNLSWQSFLIQEEFTWL